MLATQFLTIGTALCVALPAIALYLILRHRKHAETKPGSAYMREDGSMGDAEVLEP